VHRLPLRASRGLRLGGAKLTARHDSLLWHARRRSAELAARGTCPTERLIDALLRRGFLVGRDPDLGPFLARGSHPVDRLVLADILPLPAQPWPGARSPLGVPPAGQIDDVVERVLSLPEHRSGFTAIGMTGPPRTNRYESWRDYRSRAFGTKLAVTGDRQYGALDIGVALLVKALPLVGISTSYSCDGHGTGPARIGLFTAWDAIWAKLLLERLSDPSDSAERTSEWTLDGQTLQIDGRTDRVLDDIQCLARRLLDPALHRPLRAVRQRALAVQGPPSAAEWANRLRAALVDGTARQLAV